MACFLGSKIGTAISVGLPHMIKYNNGYEGVLEKTLTSTASIALALINLLLSQDPRRTMGTDPGKTKNSAGPQTLTLLLEGSLTTGVHLDSPC